MMPFSTWPCFLSLWLPLSAPPPIFNGHATKTDTTKTRTYTGDACYPFPLPSENVSVSFGIFSSPVCVSRTCYCCCSIRQASAILAWQTACFPFLSLSHWPLLLLFSLSLSFTRSFPFTPPFPSVYICPSVLPPPLLSTCF